MRETVFQGLLVNGPAFEIIIIIQAALGADQTTADGNMQAVGVDGPRGTQDGEEHAGTSLCPESAHVSDAEDIGDIDVVRWRLNRSLAICP
jgi:hypothetical protein